MTPGGPDDLGDAPRGPIQVPVLHQPHRNDHVYLAGAGLHRERGLTGRRGIGAEGEADGGADERGRCAGQDVGGQAHPAGIDADRLEAELDCFQTELPDIACRCLGLQHGRVDHPCERFGSHFPPGALTKRRLTTPSSISIVCSEILRPSTRMPTL